TLEWHTRGRRQITAQPRIQWLETKSVGSTCLAEGWRCMPRARRLSAASELAGTLPALTTILPGGFSTILGWIISPGSVGCQPLLLVGTTSFLTSPRILRAVRGSALAALVIRIALIRWMRARFHRYARKTEASVRFAPRRLNGDATCDIPILVD